MVAILHRNRLNSAQKRLIPRMGTEITRFIQRFLSKECQKKALENPDAPNEMELMKENLRLRKELEEAKKENLFLKKAAAFFAKEID